MNAPDYNPEEEPGWRRKSVTGPQANAWNANECMQTSPCKTNAWDTVEERRFSAA